MIDARLWHGGSHNHTETIESDCSPVGKPSAALFLCLTWDGITQRFGHVTFQHGKPKGPGGMLPNMGQAVQQVCAAYLRSITLGVPLVVVLETDRYGVAARRRLSIETRRWLRANKKQRLNSFVTLPRVLEVHRAAVDQKLFSCMPANQRRATEISRATTLVGLPTHPAQARAVCLGDLVSNTTLGVRAVPVSYKGMENA